MTSNGDATGVGSGPVPAAPGYAAQPGEQDGPAAAAGWAGRSAQARVPLAQSPSPYGRPAQGRPGDRSPAPRPPVPPPGGEGAGPTAATPASSFGAPCAAGGSPTAAVPRFAPGATAPTTPYPPYRMPAPVPTASAVGAAPPSGQETGPRRRGPGWPGVVAASVVAALLASGATVMGVNYLEDRSGTAGGAATAAPTALATGSTTQPVSSSGTAPDWEGVTNAVANSVVSIMMETDTGGGEGSGVIYDAAGHIVTNNHVVAGAKRIQVTLADGRIYEAEISGTDPDTDLAVIELKDAPDDLTVARLGDSTTVVTGQDVMAIGNPLGLSSTVTTGIVSALDRPVVTAQDEGGSSSGSRGALAVTNAIQIDAAINPGNSGGPLFDETGAVIGITSSIATLDGESGQSGSIGLGFAIPVNQVAKVADQLIETGSATHAYLGVDLINGGAHTDGEVRAGAEIAEVKDDSPAAAAGLKAGDVIIAIDGKATTQKAALTGFVRQHSAGDTVTLTVVRDTGRQEIKVTLAERKDT